MANLNEADLPPNLTCLKNVDTILRCPICFEFLSIAMMTKCSHNFCSLCIRKFLSYKLQCPVCNSPTTEQDLRNNRILDDLVTNFKSARQQLSNANFDSPPISRKAPASSVKCKKPRQTTAPKKEASIFNHFFRKGPTTSTTSLTTEATPAQQPIPCRKRLSDTPLRSQTVKEGPRPTQTVKVDPDHQVSVKEEPIEDILPQVLVSVKMEKIDFSMTGLASLADSQSSSQDLEPLVKVECPVCFVGILEQFINKHLDSCLTQGEKKESLRSSLGAKRKPMRKLVYTLLSMQELKKRLKECHLSAQGTRDQLVRRHQDFVHFYNAQCDALEPKSAKDIAKEVEANEKARNQLQGKTKCAMVFSKNQSLGQIDEMHSTYRKQHNSEFSRLIAQVRGRLETARTREIKQEVRDEGGEEDQGVGSSSADKAAQQEQSDPSPSDSEACCVLMTSPVEEPSEKQQQPSVVAVISRSPSPCLSEVSISSSVSDIFAGKCYEVLENTSSGKRASYSKEEDSSLPLVLGKRARKTWEEDRKESS
ncbi:E3 ubiquitin-protein ligase RAD18-like isoform X1 [Oncorhynchus keta]|uniref:E3 ubiquitin-protein ligase RAD18-like isoform X1 n=1 Tax=Oncorhynchus keta TaxID=8018 RepID=UPI0015F9F5CD|nr:E3 ubiquitin-protein ligase RAD18-like isoform X1 [Oncorhynchus keta]